MDHCRDLERTATPLPVTVHWEVGVLWLPNSSGNLNCFSLLQKWLEVPQITFWAAPPSIKAEPKDSASTKVEQAPNIPKKRHI